MCSRCVFEKKKIFIKFVSVFLFVCIIYMSLGTINPFGSWPPEADSNCLASSEYFSVCCADPCEDRGLLGATSESGHSRNHPSLLMNLMNLVFLVMNRIRKKTIFGGQIPGADGSAGDLGGRPQHLAPKSLGRRTSAAGMNQTTRHFRWEKTWIKKKSKKTSINVFP